MTTVQTFRTARQAAPLLACGRCDYDGASGTLQFNWRGVAASAVGAGVGQAVSGPMGDVFGRGTFGARLATGLIAGTAAAVARGGKVAIQQVATDAFGNALGSSLADSMSGSGSTPTTGDFARMDGAGYRGAAYEVPNAGNGLQVGRGSYGLQLTTGAIAAMDDGINEARGTRALVAMRDAEVDAAAAAERARLGVLAQQRAAHASTAAWRGGDPITTGDLAVLNAAFNRRETNLAAARNFVGPLQPYTSSGEIKPSPEMGFFKQLASGLVGTPAAFVRQAWGDLPVNPISDLRENFNGADRTLLAAMSVAPVPLGKAAQGARIGEQLTVSLAENATSALRSEAAAGIREARNVLRDAGVPLQARNEIIRSFELETFRVERVASERTALRVFDDFNARLEGRFVSTDFFPSQTDRIQNFALMSNSATRLGEVAIPQGSVIFTGRVAGQPMYGPGLTGGASQIFLTGPLSRYRFGEVMLPR